jgi:DNA-binding transcriptional MerR regulator
MRNEALKVGELARRAGLTVRTLHHYDEIGLLNPSLHSEGGHRLYTADDVARLQQVMSMRQLGFSLDEVRSCLAGEGFSPLEAVRLHVAKLREQIELQKGLCGRLEMIAARLSAAEEVSADEFLRAIEVMTMIEKMYSPEQMKQFEAAAREAGADEIRAVEEGWTALLAEVRANRDIDPSSAQAQDILRRWDELTERTMRGFRSQPGLAEAIGDNYKQGKFEGHPHAPQAADFAFIEKARSARKVE